MAPLGISRFLGPKWKKYTFCPGPNWQYRRAKLPTRFSTIGPNKGELLFGYWLLFWPTKNLRSKKQIWENLFLGLKCFPDFGAQIGQQQIFIIWQDGQTPHQSFFTNVYPNNPTSKSLYPIFVVFGPMIQYSQTPDQKCHRGPKDGK